MTYKIAGVAVNSVTGAPLAEARISLVDTKTRKSVLQQKTAEGGRFEFAGLPAGKFSLNGSKRGYISASYEQHEEYSTAIVTGPELKTDALVLRLNPVAVIGGHVRDQHGEPVRHAQVTLFMEDHRRGMSRVNRLLVAISDDLGYFDFSSLIPGTYFVSVNATPWLLIGSWRSSGVAGVRTACSVLMMPGYSSAARATSGTEPPA